MYDFELEKIVEIIEQEGYSRVLLQLPEGLRDYSASIAREIEEKTSALAIISADPCYGACDLADSQARELGAQALFHFGHSRLLSSSEVPVHYIEIKLDYEFSAPLKENLDKLPARLGLLATVQHLHRMGGMKNLLEDKGFNVQVGDAGRRCSYRGQVLGCSFESARRIAGEVDAFLYLGSGDFHPLGVALATGKPVYALDPLLSEMRSLEGKKERFLRRRYASVARAKDAESFGVVVGEKRGQRRLELALGIKEKLEKEGKEAYIISAREFTPENLVYFRKLDALVSTACPRIAIEDSQRYPQPVLTPGELEMAMEGKSEYTMDEI